MLRYKKQMTKATKTITLIIFSAVLFFSLPFINHAKAETNNEFKFTIEVYKDGSLEFSDIVYNVHKYTFRINKPGGDYEVRVTSERNGIIGNTKIAKLNAILFPTTIQDDDVIIYGRATQTGTIKVIARDEFEAQNTCDISVGDDGSPGVVVCPSSVQISHTINPEAQVTYPDPPERVCMLQCVEGEAPQTPAPESAETTTEPPGTPAEITTVTPVCGNNNLEPGEYCDGTRGVASGPYDSSNTKQYACISAGQANECTFTGGWCGNNTIQEEHGEDCDGTNLGTNSDNNTNTCNDAGYINPADDNNALSCHTTGDNKCTFDVSSCGGLCLDYEDCATSVDDNCNGSVNEGCCVDQDGDGFDNCAIGVSGDDGKPIDCNDAINFVYPAYDGNDGAQEICDGYDNDCDNSTLIDVGCDNDLDGYCDSAMQVYGITDSDPLAICPKSVSLADWSSGDDCIDTDININPGATESCTTDGDDNCNDISNEGCTCSVNETQACGTDRGECKKGTQACDGGHWANTCGGESYVAPTTETCNGTNDDCDAYGDADDPDLKREEKNDKQEGVCAGTYKICAQQTDNSWTYQNNYPALYEEESNAKNNCDDTYDNDCDGNPDDQDPNCQTTTAGDGDEAIVIVQAENTPPVIESNLGTNTDGTLTVRATDNDTMTYSLDAVSLTAGFSINSSGIITTEVSPGDYNITVYVTDGTNTSSQTFNITIAEPIASEPIVAETPAPTVTCTTDGVCNGQGCPPGCTESQDPDCGDSGCCGDGDKDPGEDCDGDDFGDATCETVPGTNFQDTVGLSCNATCIFNTNACLECLEEENCSIDADNNCDGTTNEDCVMADVSIKIFDDNVTRGVVCDIGEIYPDCTNYTDGYYDDAFKIYIDDILIGKTSLGNKNSLEISSLSVGHHTMKIVFYKYAKTKRLGTSGNRYRKITEINTTSGGNGTVDFTLSNNVKEAKCCTSAGCDKECCPELSECTNNDSIRCCREIETCCYNHVGNIHLHGASSGFFEVDLEVE